MMHHWKAEIELVPTLHQPHCSQYEDIGSMSPESFQAKLKLAEEVDNDMYWLEKQIRNL